MLDIHHTIAPKTDQLNADALLGRSITILVTDVTLREQPEQPVAIHFDGDDGKPYLPCKTMRRVLVNVWGADAKKYIGRKMTLYRDDKVMFGGTAVGGIRISHISGIERPVTMALAVTRASRKPYTVQPLLAAEPEGPLVEAKAAAAKGTGELKTFWDGLSGAQRKALQSHMPGLKEIAAKIDVSSEVRDEGAIFAADQRGYQDFARNVQQIPASLKTAGGAVADAWFAGWDRAAAEAAIAQKNPPADSSAPAALEEELPAGNVPPRTAGSSPQSQAYIRGREDFRKGITLRGIPAGYASDPKGTADWKRGWNDESKEQQSMRNQAAAA